MAKTIELQAIVEHLKNERENETMEGELLKQKMIRELYKQLGEPKQEDFPDEFRVAGTYWNKRKGYTKGIDFLKERTMLDWNRAPVDYCINKPSERKKAIIEEYAGWNITVQAFNVLCNKYVKHPKYENIWVCFYSSRDCNKYEYVIEV